MNHQRRYPVELLSSPLHETLLGTSSAMSEANDLIKRLAKTNLTVLVTGETGTGKDITARMLHRLSPRSGKPFVKVNCPAIPESILESELFGYERGAFTGAGSAKPGRLELAHTGTIFLDEIAEMSYAVQGKLLQLLDGEPIMRIGGVTPIQCDVRVIAATNVTLEEAVQQERLREDVYFRLSEVQIHIPPLRDRVQDIPLLAEHFNYNFLQKLGRPYEPIPMEYIEEMQELSWRGNVRELAACVKKYVATNDHQMLFGDDRDQESSHRRGNDGPTALVDPVIGKGMGASPVDPENDGVMTGRPSQGAARKFIPLKEATRRAVESTERALIEEALRQTLWNRRKAAKLLEVSYSSLLRRIDAYGIGKKEAENETS